MRIKSLSLNNFRNFSSQKINFKQDLIIFVGQNGSGKTNILEAIWYLSIPRSFRVKRDHYLIKWGEAYARLSGLIEDQDACKEVVAFLECGGDKTCVFPKDGRGKVKKELKVNNAKVRAIDLLGEFITVLFTPEDINLITAPPQKRRQYLDMILCQTDTKYCHHLMDYKRVLAQRNKLLVSIQKNLTHESSLDVWDERLIELGLSIIKKRQEVFKFFEQDVRIAYQRLSSSKENLSLLYLPRINADREKFEATVISNRQRDIMRGRTGTGPHRDDFVFLLDSKQVSQCGSRGECRSAILAMKEAELSYIEEITHRKPVLLLDDVFSELDDKRQQELLGLTKGRQTFVTTTGLGDILETLADKHQTFEIKDGQIV